MNLPMRPIKHADIAENIRLLGIPSHARYEGTNEYVRIHFEPIDLKEFDVWLVTHRVMGVGWLYGDDKLDFLWQDAIHNFVLQDTVAVGTAIAIAPDFGIEDREAKIYYLSDYRK